MKVDKKKISEYNLDKYLPRRYTSRGKPTIKYLDKDFIYIKQPRAGNLQCEYDDEQLACQPPSKKLKDDIHPGLRSNRVMTSSPSQSQDTSLPGMSLPVSPIRRSRVDILHTFVVGFT